MRRYTKTFSWATVFCAALILTIILSPFGCSKFQPESKEIKIGAILPLTGDGAKYGTSARKAIDLAFSEVNSNGGIKGKKISVVYEDTKGVAKDGVSAIQKLITVHKVPAIIGDLLSSVTLAVAPVAEKNHVVLLSPTSSAPKITDAGDYIFRNCASDIFEGKVMADAAIQKFGIKKVAILYINNDYGVGITNIFKKTLIAHGGQIVAEETFNQGATDFRAQLTKITTLQFDGIYIVGYKELGHLLKQAHELGIKAQFMSTVMFEDPDILSIAGNAADGIVYSARAFDPDSEEPHVKEFVASFKQHYEEEPDIFAAYAYDAARILIQAMNKGELSADAIKQSIYAIKDFLGVTGLTSFDDKGDVFQPAYLKTVNNGKFTWLK